MIAALLLTLQIAMPDSTNLRRLADSANVPASAVLAIAWQESNANLDPRLRGHHCWWSIRRDSATVIVHHEPDCEVGRFQIKPSTARSRCPGLSIWHYDGNVQCFLKMFREDVDRYGVIDAIRRHNGSGRSALAYTESVLATVGRLTLQQKDGVYVGR